MRIFMRIPLVSFILLFAASTAHAQIWQAQERVDNGAIPINASLNVLAVNNVVHVVYRGLELAAAPGSQDGIFYVKKQNNNWTAPLRVANVTGGEVGGLNIEILQGELFVIYDVSNGAVGQIFYTRDLKSGGATWAPAALLHPNISSPARNNFRIRTAATGSKILGVWEADDPSGEFGADADIWFSEFSGVAWSAPALVNTNAAFDTGNDTAADPAFGPDGIAYCVWGSTEDINESGTDQDIFIATRDGLGPWTDPELVSTGSILVDRAPRVAVTELSNEVFVLWEGGDDIYYAKYSTEIPGKTITEGPATIAGYMDTDVANDHDVGVFATGNDIYAVWVSRHSLPTFQGLTGDDADVFWAGYTEGSWRFPRSPSSRVYVNEAINDGITPNVRVNLFGSGIEGHAVWQTASALYHQKIVLLADNDADGVPDILEFTGFGGTGTDPGKTDTDGDGMPDGYELVHGLNPVVADGQLDKDNDGITNLDEFNRGTSPDNTNDPPRQLRVDGAAGNDTSGDGSIFSPYKTIGRALEVAATTANPLHPVEVLVAAGIYDERLAIPPHVTVRGAGRDAAIIQRWSEADTDHTLVTMGDNASLLDVSVRWGIPQVPVPANLVRVILTPANANFAIGRCRLDGRNSTQTTGIRITGGTLTTARIFENLITKVGIGMFASNSGVNFTRNEVLIISGDAIFVTFSPAKDKQSGVNVPMLGEDADVGHTALNIFRDVSGKFINNETGEVVNAEMNDWGVYNRDDVAGWIQGPADFGPIVGKSLAPGAVVASMYLGNTEQIVGADTNPQASIPQLGLTAERDAESGLFLFASVSGGSWSVQGSATGFVTDTQNVNVNVASVNAVNLRLFEESAPPPPIGGGCGKSTEFSYAWAGLIIWAAGRRLSRTKRAPRS